MIPQSVSKPEIEQLIAQLNQSAWFRQEFSCINFAAAAWYHFGKAPVFPSQERLQKIAPTIEHICEYLLMQQLFEDEVRRDYLIQEPNLTLIAQAQTNRSLPLHASILLLDEQSNRYILQKDGTDPVQLIPLAEWKTYKEEFPVYAAYLPHVAEMLLQKDD